MKSKKKQTKNKVIPDNIYFDNTEGLLRLNSFLFEKNLKELYYPYFPNKYKYDALKELLNYIKPVSLWIDKKCTFSSSRWIGKNKNERFDLTIGYCDKMKNQYLRLDKVTENERFLSHEEGIEIFTVYYQKTDIDKYRANVKSIISGKFNKLV